MSKTKTEEVGAAEVAPQAQEAFELTLEEFCTRLSAGDRRVEMIGGFYAAEKQAGRLKDFESAFAGRYAAFQRQPA